MKRWTLGCFAVAGLVALAGCQQHATPETAARLAIKKISGEKVQFVPAKGQLTYCLIFTRAERGPLRLLTMTYDNRSPHCPAEKPVQPEKFTDGRIPKSAARPSR